MAECFRCGISDEKAKLYDAISENGIVKICGDCNALERYPLIKKPSDTQIEDSKRQKSVREMMSGMNKSKLLAGREVSLRELVDRNLKERKEKLPSDLIDNFNWTIQRIRRSRKITREQFSKGIGEPESTVRMIESGVLPNNDYKIINKIEGYLGISLRKKGASGFPNTESDYAYASRNTTTGEQPRRSMPEPVVSEPPKRKLFGFNRNASNDVKIADLREMKKRQEETGKKPVDSWEEERSQDDEKFLDKSMEDEDLFDDDL
jgi:ribosome-binding protein aMBF1 (putative translation factor)